MHLKETLALRPQLRLSSMLFLLTLAAMAIGWYVDNYRWRQSYASMQKELNRKIDNQWLGLTSREAGYNFEMLFSHYRRLDPIEFEKQMEGEALLTLSHLFNHRLRADELDLDPDSRTLARRIVELLGCKSASEFRLISNKHGITEDGYVWRSVNPTPEEIEEFYDFIGLSEAAKNTE